MKYPLAQIRCNCWPSLLLKVHTFYEMFPLNSSTNWLIHYSSFGWLWEIHLFNLLFNITFTERLLCAGNWACPGGAVMKILIVRWFSWMKWSIKPNVQPITVVWCDVRLWQRLPVATEYLFSSFSLWKGFSFLVLIMFCLMI